MDEGGCSLAAVQDLPAASWAGGWFEGGCAKRRICRVLGPSAHVDMLPLGLSLLIQTHSYPTQHRTGPRRHTRRLWGRLQAKEIHGGHQSHKRSLLELDWSCTTSKMKRGSCGNGLSFTGMG